MRILVTGGTGFLGSHLCKRLVAGGHDVSVLCRPSSDISVLNGLGIQTETCDLGDSSAVKKAVKDKELVVHAAAGTIPAVTVQERYEVNVNWAHTIVDGCIESRVRRLLHVSSVAAIGVPKNSVPADESFEFNLERSRLYYHLSKKRCEDVVRDGVSRGLDAVIVNPGSVWGPFGTNYRGREMLNLVRSARMLRYSSGGVNNVHVDDVVNGMMAALNKGVTGERYILGGDNLSHKNWLMKMAQAIDSQPVMVPVPKFVTDVASSILGPLSDRKPSLYGPFLRSYLAGRKAYYCSKKAEKFLGFSPRPFAAILAECAVQELA